MPKLVFLSETKKSKAEMDNILFDSGDLFGIFVDSRGRAGDLALLWDKNIDVDLLSCSFHHIDVSVRLEEEDNTWRFSGIYGWPDFRYK